MLYKDLFTILTDIFTLGGTVALIDMFCICWLFKHLLKVAIYFFKKLWHKKEN